MLTIDPFELRKPKVLLTVWLNYSSTILSSVVEPYRIGLNMQETWSAAQYQVKLFVRFILWPCNSTRIWQLQKWSTDKARFISTLHRIHSLDLTKSMLLGSEFLCTQQPLGNSIFLVIPQTLCFLYGLLMLLSVSVSKSLRETETRGNTGSKISNV